MFRTLATTSYCHFLDAHFPFNLNVGPWVSIKTFVVIVPGAEIVYRTIGISIDKPAGQCGPMLYQYPWGNVN